MPLFKFTDAARVWSRYNRESSHFIFCAYSTQLTRSGISLGILIGRDRMQCQSVKTASKLVRIHILRAHKASFRSGPLQCYDTRARFLSVTDFSTISYNVHHQIRSQKKPLANVFEELKAYVDGYNQIKANKKLAEAIQTFYFHCGQDAVQLPPLFVETFSTIIVCNQ